MIKIYRNAVQIVCKKIFYQSRFSFFIFKQIKNFNYFDPFNLSNIIVARFVKSPTTETDRIIGPSIQ